MKRHSLWKTGLAGLVLAGSVMATVGVADALPGGTPPTNGLGNGTTGGLRLAPGSGTESTPIAVQLTPTNQACPGNNNAGWAWSTFITPFAQDPATLTFAPSGQPIATAAGTTSALRNGSGTFIRGEFPDLTTFQITEPSNLSLAETVPAGLAPGKYYVGIACFDANGPANDGVGAYQNEKYWATTMTVTDPTPATPATYSWALGVAPDAPVLSLGAGTGTTQTINVVPNASVDSYNLVVTPAPSGPLPTVAPGASSFQLTGLTLGTAYNVSLEAVEAGFAPVPGVLSFSAAASGPQPVVVATDAFQGAAATVSWTIPTVAGVPAPVSYDVTVSGPTTVTPFTSVAGPSVTIPASELAPGDYTATVTPKYAAGSGVSANPGSDTFSINLNTLLYQEITVARPPGALVLTQKCGVYGALDPFTAVDSFPGFPRTLTTFGTAVASTPGINPAPDVDVSPAGDFSAGEYTADPNFGQYPEVGSYPTECGLAMGTARLVGSGNLAGQFYTADGRLNQVTVLDTRDIDAGWTARGDIEDNFTSGGNTFDGNFLGWIPKVTDDSDPVGGSSYDQVVTPGATVLPGTGTTGASVPASPYSATGLKGNVPLAAAAPAAGLGIATLDARMQLLIPASANAGDYSATLSLTVA